MGRFRISAPLLLATAGALAIIVALALVGLRATQLADDGAAAGSDAAILSATAAIARHSGSVASYAGVPTALTMTPDRLAERSAAADRAETALTESIAALESAVESVAGAGSSPGYEGRLAAIRAHADALLAGASRIDDGRPELRRLWQEGQENYRKFSYDYNESLDSALVTSLDDQLYDMMTWEVAPGDSADPAANPVSRRAVLRYQHTFELLASVRVAVGRLLEASVLSHPFQVVIVREEYEAAAQRIRSSLDDRYLQSGDGDPASHSEIVRLVGEILDAGSGENNLFQSLDRRLRLAAVEQGLIAGNAESRAALHQEIDALLAEVRQRGAGDAAATARYAAAVRIIILVIGIAGILGALATAGYFAARAARR